MKRNIHLHIPEPCHENWQAMTPVEKGRFCAVCSTQVTDFSSMNDRELAVFFKKHAAEKICGRFRNDQLDRDLAIPRKRVPWVRYFFTVALPSLLFTMKTKAQGQVLVKLRDDQAVTRTTILQRNSLNSISRPAPLRPVGYLKWSDAEQETGTNLPLIPDRPGYFFNREISIDYVVVSRIAVFTNIEIPPCDFGYKSRSPEVKTKPTSMKQDFFKIYPDPVTAGGDIHLQIAEPEEGYFQYNIIAADGRLLKEDKIWMDNKARMINLVVPETAPGVYFISLINSTTGQKFTERFLVQ